MPMTAADLTVKVGADTSDFEAGMGKVDGTLNKSKAGMGAATGIMGAGALAIGGGFMFAANSAMNFEGAMADVDASLMPTTQQLAALEKEALRIGATTTFNATEGAQAIEQLGLAGISIPDIMNGGAMSVARLASATGEDLPNSATAMANAMTIFGIAGSDTEAVADTMTAALNESSMTLTDFQQGMASAGVMADSVGMSFEQTSAALALFSANGMSGADAGTSLRSMLTHMANPTAEAAALFDQLGFSLQEGIDSGNLMGYTAEKLTAGLAHMSEEERLAALNTMFGADAQRVANILYGEGAEGVNNMTEKMKANGQAQEAARRRMGGLRGAMESLSGSVETAAIIIGSGLTPFLTVLAEKVGDAVNWLTNLPEPLIRLMSVVAAVVGALMGLGAAFGSVMMMGGLIPGGFGAVGSAMLSILGPVALVVAAAVGLYVAFQTNFLGIRDIVTGAIDAISTAFGALSDILMGTITGDLDRVAEGFENLAEPLQPLGDFVRGVTREFVGLYNAFEAGGLSGLMDALPGALRNIGTEFRELGSAIIDGIGNIDWGGIASGLGDFASGIGTWLMDQLGRVPWAALWQAGVSALSSAGTWLAEKLGDAVTAIGSWLTTQLGAVPWAALWQAGVSAVSSAGSWLADKLGDAATAIGTWLTGQLGRVPWASAFRTGVSALSSAGAWLVEALGSIANKIQTWVTAQFSGVSWPTVIASMGANLRAAVTSAIQGMASVATDILNWLTAQIEGVNWESVGTTFGTLLVGAVKGIAGGLALGAWFTGQILLGIVGVDWGGVTSAFGTFLRAAFEAVGDFLSGVFDVVLDELEPVIAGAVSLVNDLINQLNRIPGVDIEPIRYGFEGMGMAAGSATGNVNIAADAIAKARQEAETLNQAAKDANTSITTMLTPNAAGRGQMQAGGSVYANPYNPTEGGAGGMLEPSPIESSMGGGMSQLGGILGGIATEAAKASLELGNTNAALNGMIAYAGPVTDFGGVATTTFSATGESAKTNMQPIGGYVSSMAGSVLGAALPAFSSLLSGARSNFTGVQTEAQSRFSSMASAIGTNTASAAATALANATGMATGVKGQVSGMASDASAKASSMNTKVSAEALGMQVSAVAKATAMAVGFAVQMSLMVSAAITGGSQITSAMQNGMQGATAAVSAHASGWVGIVNAAAGALGGAGYNAGAAAGFGVANGLMAALGAVQAAAAAIAATVAVAMAAKLAIASPSKVTTQLGLYAGQGLAVGILDMRPMVERNARTVAIAAARAFEVDTSGAVLASMGGDTANAPRGLMQRTGQSPQYVYNDYRAFTVKVDDLPELVRATEFLDDLERDREQMYGGR